MKMPVRVFLVLLCAAIIAMMPFAISSPNMLNDIKMELMNDGEDESLAPGDANGDGEVNAEDIVAIIDYLMGKDVAGFKADTADANEDGVVDTADIVSIVNIIMSE